MNGDLNLYYLVDNISFLDFDSFNSEASKSESVKKGHSAKKPPTASLLN